MAYLLGCGCLLGLIVPGLVFLLGIPTAVRKGRKLGRQKAALARVNLDALSEGDRARWQSYDAQIGRQELLSAGQLAEVQAWPTR